MAGDDRTGGTSSNGMAAYRQPAADRGRGDRIGVRGADRPRVRLAGLTVMCFHPDPGTTRGEAQYIGRMAATDGWSSVILVTTPDQAWRARLRICAAALGRRGAVC
jgi:hypothetical protein